MEYLAEWNCGKCGRALRARFKPESVRGPYFTEHEVACPDCNEAENLILKPYRLDRREGDVWTKVW